MKGILIDAGTGDLLVERGGIAVGDTEGQTAEAVVLTMRGELKEHPLLGGEAGRMRGGQPDVMWAGEVRQMLRGCGVECERVTMEADGTISIER
ncbi:MAG: hypothetical protein J6C91_10210 [Muribaculaceae bacterium]|nr:hypothetical protein [Muribaculaceae bacterium]